MKTCETCHVCEDSHGVCGKCGRPYSVHGFIYRGDPKVCIGDHVCGLIATAYRRGILRGVEIAKEKAQTQDVYAGNDIILASVEWSDVDAAVKEEVGDG